MPLKWLPAVAGILALGLVLAHTERNEQAAQHAHYCEMVEIHNESEGRYGWPNYDNRECN